MLRPRQQVREADDDVPVTRDIKLDQLDKRKELVLKLLGKAGAVRLDEVEHTSL